MQLSKVILSLVAICFSTPAFSKDAALQHIPRAEIVGEGTLSVAFWDIYHATLYAPNGTLHTDKSFALSIRYLLFINGEDIADRSIEEMQKQGFQNAEKMAVWNQQMKNIFPNVYDGAILTAVFIPGKETIFYYHNRQAGIIKDAEFTRIFSNIWLAENTSEPELRNKLLKLS